MLNMSSRRAIFTAFAAAAGAATAYIAARETRKFITRHQAEGRALRGQYVSTYPVQQHTVRIAGCDTNVYEAGPLDSDAPPLLLIHGGVVEAASWLETVTALCSTRRVIAPDLPTHGTSGYLPPHQLLHWLEAVVVHYQLEQFDLCGHSLGGALALRYAARQPQNIRRLVLCAPAGTGQLFPRVWPEPWNTGLLESFPLHSSLIEKIWGDAALITSTHRAQFNLLVRDFFLTHRWWWYATGGALWLLDIPLSQLKSISIPTLFLWGDRDRVVPFSGERTMRYVQAIPNAHLLILPTLGHLPQVEAPAAFNAALHEFLINKSA